MAACMVTNALLWLLAVFLLVALNAFFVAAEFALVSLRDTRIQQLIDARRIGARTVQRLHNRLDEVLNMVQFGITVTSLALGWIGEPAVARLLRPLLGEIPFFHAYSFAISILIAFTLITYIHMILGEVVPKSLALQRAERVALAVAAPLDFLMRLCRPFLWVMTNSGRLVLRLFGSRMVMEGGVHSPQELKMIVTASRRVGLLPSSQEEMVHRVLDLDGVTVREVMVPRPAIFSLPADLPLDEAAMRVVDEQHSRVPLFDPALGPEHIVGVLYAKDVMRWMRQWLATVKSGAPPPPAPKVRLLMREVMLVPESKPLPDLLQEFRARKHHLAVVVDEFGSTAGLVTVEDVLEQIVGEIEDEFDVERPPFPRGAATMVLDGSENIRDLEHQYQLTLPREEGFETLAGFVLARLQKIPRSGDSFQYDRWRFTVLEVEGRRVTKVKVEAVQPELKPLEHSAD
jgi:putative hemolysin